MIEESGGCCITPVYCLSHNTGISEVGYNSGRNSAPEGHPAALKVPLWVNNDYTMIVSLIWMATVILSLEECDF